MHLDFVVMHIMSLELRQGRCTGATNSAEIGPEIERSGPRRYAHEQLTSHAPRAAGCVASPTEIAQPVSAGTIVSSVMNQVRPFSIKMTLRRGAFAFARR